MERRFGVPHESADRLRTWQRSARRFVHFYGAFPYVTVTFIALFVAVHAVTGVVDLFTGRPPWFAVFGARSTEVLELFGGRVKALVEAGEHWRLVSYAFLHGDAAHLFFNSLAFWVLGRPAEAVFGPVRLVWLFVVCAIGGALLSQLGPAPISVGASGGVFGMMGALVAFGLRRRNTMPPGLRELFTRQMWPWILLNLIIGAVVPLIDQRAHVGGLLTGAVAGWFLGDRVTEVGRGHVAGQVVMGVTAGALIAWAFARVVVNIG